MLKIVDRTAKERYQAAWRDYRVTRQLAPLYRIANWALYAGEIYSLPANVIDSFAGAYLWTKGTTKEDSLPRLLFRLGERVERAELDRDIDTIVLVDKQLSEISIANTELWIELIVVRGQNNIRRARNLKDLDL